MAAAAAATASRAYSGVARGPGTCPPCRCRCLQRHLRFARRPGSGWLLRSNTSRSCHRPGAKMGSHSAKSRQESGGVWTVICSGKQNFANLLDSSRPARGLLHTEEVTGSIPVSPTDVSPGQKLHEQLSSYSADGSCRRIGRNLGDRVLPREHASPGSASAMSTWRPRCGGRSVWSGVSHLGEGRRSPPSADVRGHLSPERPLL
jgi:hypothetical protein